MVFLGVHYTEDIYEQGDTPETIWDEWLDVKENLGLAFPSLPYFIDGNARLTNHTSIMRFIAHKYGQRLLGTTPSLKGKVAMISE